MPLTDTLAVASAALFTVLTIISVACAPRQDLGPRERRSLLFIYAGTMLAYLGGSPFLFLLGWGLTVLPALLDSAMPTWPRIALLLSLVALAGGFLITGLAQSPAIHTTGFALLLVAVLLRKGIFPFHTWVTRAFEDGSLPQLNLLLNSHLGAYLMMRFVVPFYPDLAAQSLFVLSGLAIFTAMYAAILAIAAEKPRRILALLATSQASFILAGLENRNVEGITGALVHWWVVAFSITALLAVYRALEARTSDVAAPDGFLGLGFHAPRLAVFFTVGILALVGLPGTLGFAAEDLLFHGALESHPMLGIGLPLATALNAITGLRLIATLFLGKRGIHVPVIPDARKWERWALSVPVLFLVVCGLAPRLVIAFCAPAAKSLAGLLATP